MSCAKLFTSTFGVSYSLCLWIGAAVVVGYTLLGGYMAVCWTDFIQGSLMFLAIVLVPTLVVCGAGGFGATADGLDAINPHAARFDAHDAGALTALFGPGERYRLPHRFVHAGVRAAPSKRDVVPTTTRQAWWEARSSAVAASSCTTCVRVATAG